MSNSVPEHEKLFDEICNKLNELSKSDPHEVAANETPKSEKMQALMKKFNSELNDSQSEMQEKIRNLEKVSYGPEDLDKQLKQLADQLNNERSHNARMSADLAKSLELGLQLQLEIQGLKGRSFQMQTEEKKYSQALYDKCRTLQRDLELTQALKEETAMELAKAKSSFAKDQSLWENEKASLETQIQSLNTSKSETEQTCEELKAHLENKEQEIQNLNAEIDKISLAFTDVEGSALKQSEVLKNLMEVAERKIVEMKLALDKKSLEAQDYYGHLQQSLTQSAVLQQENQALKEYATKLNQYHQHAQAMQMQQLQQQPQPQPGN